MHLFAPAGWVWCSELSLNSSTISNLIQPSKLLLALTIHPLYSITQVLSGETPVLSLS